ncbi:MAG: hypothetical protein GYB65_12365 [Chloroflexi bacterium]|nr:hypothetical protein [Chloroflexota bacterium]
MKRWLLLLSITGLVLAGVLTALAQGDGPEITDQYTDDLGNTVTVYADGTTTIVHPGGLMLHIAPDGGETLTYPGSNPAQPLPVTQPDLPFRPAPITAAYANRVILLEAVDFAPQTQSNRLSFAPDGSRLGVVDAAQVLLYDSGALWRLAQAPYPGMTINGDEPAAPELPTATLDRASWITALAFSPDGMTVALAAEDGTIALLDLESGETTAAFTTQQLDRASCAAFSPDGDMLAVGYMNQNVDVWDLASGEQRAALTTDDQVWDVAFSPDGTRLASTDGDLVHVWDVASGEPLATMTGHTDLVWSIAFSPDGMRLASGSWDGRVFVWDSAAGTLENRLPGHAGFVNSVSFSADGTLIASAGDDRVIRLWDAASGEQLNVLSGHQGRGVVAAFDPTGTLLASVAWDGDLRLWAVSFAVPPADVPPPVAVQDDPLPPPPDDAQDGQLVDDVPDGDASDGDADDTPDPEPEATPTAAPPVINCTVSSGDFVNLRSGPGTTFSIETVLEPGQRANVTGQVTGTDGFVWWQLLDSTWARSDVVDASDGCTDVPVVEP